MKPALIYTMVFAFLLGGKNLAAQVYPDAVSGATEVKKKTPQKKESTPKEKKKEKTDQKGEKKKPQKKTPCRWLMRYKKHKLLSMPVRNQKETRKSLPPVTCLQQKTRFQKRNPKKKTASRYRKRALLPN